MKKNISDIFYVVLHISLYQCRMVRPFVHLLHFFYLLLKDLVVPFFQTDVFYYVTHVTIFGDKTTWRNTTKFQVKCTNT